MDDQRRRCALARGFFIFIRPAAIIGHRPAAEWAFQTFGAEIGIVDHDDHGLALYIEPGIVVPAFFRRVDAIAYKHDVAVFDFGLGCFPIAGDHIVSAIIGRRRLECRLWR